MVTKITSEEFIKVAGHLKVGRPSSLEGEAIRLLPPGEGIYFLCKWSHRPQCSGTILAYKAAYSRGFKIKTTCKDKVVYVLRK